MNAHDAESEGRLFSRPVGALGGSKAEAPAPEIPDYELLMPIGRGGYGEVWLARTVMGGFRAIKIVYRHAFETAKPFDRECEGIKRFEPVSQTSESQIKIFHVGRRDGFFYYVMELADNAEPEGSGSRDANAFQSETRNPDPETYSPRTLRSELQRRGRLPIDECVEIALRLTQALAHLHRHGLVHRDIKPSNIIFVNGQPKLADIGLVTDTEGTLTFVGTEGYLPPEGPGRPRADIFSLGKVFYEISTGQDRNQFPELPVGWKSTLERDAFAEFNEVIIKACAADQAQRYESAEQMFQDLLLLRAGKSLKRMRFIERRARILVRAAASLTLLAAVIAGGFLYQRRQTSIATHLARQEAVQRERAEDALFNVEIKRAQEFLGQDKTGPALAHLAQLLRRHPTNRFIAEQILSTLSSRNVALPLARLSLSNEVRHVRFNAGGSSIVTASKTGVIQVWDAKTAELSLTITPETEAHAVQISTDGEWVAMAGDGDVRVVSTHTGKHETKFAIERAVDRISFDRNNSRLILIQSNEVRVVNAKTGRQLLGPLKHDGKVTSAEFSFAADRLVTTSRHKAPPRSQAEAAAEVRQFVTASPHQATARLWDAETGVVLREFPHQTYPRFPTPPKLSPDGKRMITLLQTGTMPGNAARIWNTETGEPLSELIDCTFPIQVAEFSPDGSKVLLGGNGRQAWICDGHTGRRLFGPFEYEEAVSGASFSPDGNTVAIGCWEGTIRLWDCTTGTLVAVPLRHVSSWTQIYSTAFSPNGEQLLVHSGGVAWLWDIRPGAAKGLQLPHDEAVTFAQFSSDGKRIVTTMDEHVSSSIWVRPTTGRAAVVWDAQSGRPLTRLLSHERGVITAAFSLDGKRVVTASWDRTARLWDVEAGEPIGEPLQHPGPVRSAFFSADGKQLWTGCRSHSAWLWDVETGALIRDVLKSKAKFSENPHSSVRSDDLSPDGKWIVTSSSGSGSSVQVWDAQTGEPRFATQLFGREIRTARFSPDGERFVTASIKSEDAYVWNARSGERLAGPLVHNKGERLHSAEFSPDGKKVVTSGQDGTACIWDSHTGRLTAPPLQHKGEVLHAEFSPDGKRVVTASWWDHAAFLWDAETGFQIGQPLQHEDWVTHAAFSPDGKWVVTTSADKTARIWEVPVATASIPEWLPELAEAVAGQRLDANGTAQPVPRDRLLELRVRLIASASTDPYTQWAQWFFSARSSRGLSASSGLSAER